MKLLDFHEAVAIARDNNKRPHVLLGNGFSQACKDDIFAYDALLNRADFSGVSEEAWQAFDRLGTTDFEEVMWSLANAAELVQTYAPNQDDLARQMTEDSAGLRDVLITAIAKSHPDYPFEIDDKASASCKSFLSEFHHIFTVNYDLLLYWTLMRADIDPKVKSDDGFRTPEEGEALYVTWEPENVHRQNVHYLHGALHLFDAGHELQKYTWINTGERLIDQIRAAMIDGKFPLFVAEGRSEQKLKKIRHSAYLSKAERSLNSIGNSLFTFGHSLASNDDHVIRAILHSKVDRLFVGVHGDPTSAANVGLISRAEGLPDRRRSNRSLEVQFYDSDTAKVWG